MAKTIIKIKTGKFSGEKAEILQPPNEEWDDFEVKLKTGASKGKKICLMREEFEYDYSRMYGESIK